MDLKGRAVLVTGASKGIGRSIAIALSEEGMSVIINFKSDKESASDVLEMCNKYSKNNLVIQADVSREGEVKEMFKQISEKHKSLDGLVNNAGIYSESDNPNDTNMFQKIYQTNLLGQIIVTNEFLRYCKSGKIVNISSVHGELGHGNPAGIAYSSLKAAFNSYTKNLAKSLAPKILVNAIAPGYTLTPQWGEMTKEEIDHYSQRQLIERFVDPEEIADGVVFLLKNDAVCGEILTIDGGLGLKVLD
jgi:3-oxoacyl-[acyl-carrier protein] reductase